MVRSDTDKRSSKRLLSPPSFVVSFRVTPGFSDFFKKSKSFCGAPFADGLFCNPLFSNQFTDAFSDTFAFADSLFDGLTLASDLFGDLTFMDDLFDFSSLFSSNGLFNN